MRSTTLLVTLALLSWSALVYAGVDVAINAEDSSAAQIQQIAREAWEHYFPSSVPKAHLRATNETPRLLTGLGVGFDPNTGVNKFIPVVSFKYSAEEVTIGDKTFQVPEGVTVVPSSGQYFPRKTSTVYSTIGDYVSTLRKETLAGSTVADSMRSETESGAVTRLDVQELYDRFYKGPDSSLLAQELQGHIFFEAKVASDKLELDRFVQRAVDTLPEEYDEAAYFEFIYWWGGIYTTATKMGGIVSLETRLKRAVTSAMTDDALKSNMRRDLLSQIDASLAPTPPDAAYIGHKLANNIRWLGGVPDQAAEHANFTQWLEGVSSNPVVIEATGGLISNLITNAKKSGNLAQAYDKVLSLEDKAGRSDMQNLQACEANTSLCHGAGSCLVTGACVCDSAHKGPDCAWNVGDMFDVTTYEVVSSPNELYRTLEGDVDGDGKTDIVRMGGSPTALHVLISNGDGTYAQQAQTLEKDFGDKEHVSGFVTIQGDFNADGKMDFLRMGEAPSTIYTYIGDGKGKFHLTLQRTGYNFHDQWDSITYATAVGDFNGDHKTDFVRIGDRPARLYHFFSNGDGTFTTGTFSTDWDFHDGEEAYPFLIDWIHGPRDLAYANTKYVTFAGDIDGDGSDDIVRIGDSPANAYVFLSKKDGTWGASKSAICGLNFDDGLVTKQHRTVVGDVNGDGRVDVVRMGPGATGATVIHSLMSVGDGTFECVSQPANGWNFGTGPDQYESFALDFNGDGNTDIVRILDSKAYLFESIGDGNFKFSLQDLPAVASYVTRKGSFDGSGIDGFVQIGRNPTVVYTAWALGF